VIPPLNNPGNVTALDGGEQWLGQVGIVNVDGVKLVKFDTIENGIRACGVDSLSILHQSAVFTFDTFATTYAGVKDDGYASVVAGAWGMMGDFRIPNIVLAEQLALLMDGIFKAEGSTQRDPTSAAQRIQGATEALQHFGVKAL
jgi:hypothetical protein